VNKDRSPERGAASLRFSCFSILGLVLFHTQLVAILNLASRDERYTVNLLIPFISVGLIWLKRETIFAGARYCLRVGLPLMLSGIALFAVTKHSLATATLAMLIAWIGGFLWCYGVQPARGAIFPLLFSLLMVPIPPSVFDKVVILLQRGSAETTYRLFKAADVPVSREGQYQFALPGVTIQVAEECSGIRSTLSLFIGSIIVGYLFLRSNWNWALFALVTIPISIFKNAVRIVTISWLGVYIDPGFLTGRLHHYGGLPFSLLAMAILAAVLFPLHRLEGHLAKEPR
jgi:exosortase